MDKNSNKFMRANIARSRRLVEALPILKERNKSAKYLASIEANYKRVAKLS